MLSILPLANNTNYSISTVVQGVSLSLRFFYLDRSKDVHVDCKLADGTVVFTSKRIEPVSPLVFPVNTLEHNFEAVLWLMPKSKNVSADMLYWANNYTLILESYTTVG